MDSVLKELLIHNHMMQKKTQFRSPQCPKIRHKACSIFRVSRFDSFDIPCHVVIYAIEKSCHLCHTQWPNLNTCYLFC